MIAKWVNKYVGIPYRVKGLTLDGCDCFSLIDIILRKEFNIKLPMYEHLDTVEMDTTSEYIEIQKDGWIKLSKPEPNSIILLNICGYPVHMGLVLDDEYMIHSLKGHDSVIEKFTGMKWNKRTEGFYRYEAIS